METYFLLFESGMHQLVRFYDLRYSNRVQKNTTFNTVHILIPNQFRTAKFKFIIIGYILEKKYYFTHKC